MTSTTKAKFPRYFRCKGGFPTHYPNDGTFADGWAGRKMRLDEHVAYIRCDSRTSVQVMVFDDGHEKPSHRQTIGDCVLMVERGDWEEIDAPPELPIQHPVWLINIELMEPGVLRGRCEIFGVLHHVELIQVGDGPGRTQEAATSHGVSTFDAIGHLTDQRLCTVNVPGFDGDYVLAIYPYSD